MIESRVFYRVECDGCHGWLNSEGYGYSVFESEHELRTMLSDYEFVQQDEKYYHNDCAPPQCENCEEYGHWDEDCPKPAREGRGT